MTKTYGYGVSHGPICECMVCIINRHIVQNAYSGLPLNSGIPDSDLQIGGTDCIDSILNNDVSEFWEGVLDMHNKVTIIATPLLLAEFPNFSHFV